jgi:hypothetical protein
MERSYLQIKWVDVPKSFTKCFITIITMHAGMIFSKLVLILRRKAKHVSIHLLVICYSEKNFHWETL